MRDPDWLLDSTPREVQLEALRRSYSGFRLREDKDGFATEQQFRDGPAKGWGHFLEMRLGKTPTTLNEFELLLRDHGFKRMVAVCPNSFKDGWVVESLKSAASVPWFTFETSKDKYAWKDAKDAKGEFGVAINYESLKTEKAQTFLEHYVDKETYIAFDESIKLKNPQSAQSKTAKEIADMAGSVRMLSGLPMTQGPQDLYWQLRMMRELNGLNFFAFRNRYCKMGGFKGKKVVGVKNEDRLNAALRRVSFIAKKKDWGKQTGAEYFIEMITQVGVLKKHYDEMDNELVTMLESGEEISADMVVTKLGKMAQISSGFIYHEGKTHLLMDPRKVPKMEYLLEMMEQTNEKVIVVYQYNASGDALLETLKEYNPACIRSNQWMKREGVDPETEKKRFNNDPSCRVMVLQTTSGKYGHDLSGIDGDRCRIMVFYENTYSLDDRSQIEMRNTTAFQDWANEYYDLVSAPVERRAVEALAAKEDVAEAVLGAFRDEEKNVTERSA